MGLTVTLHTAHNGWCPRSIDPRTDGLHVNHAMVCPVHHVSRREAHERVDFSVGVGQQSFGIVIFLLVVRGIHIKPSIIFHSRWICAEIVRQQRISTGLVLCRFSQLSNFFLWEVPHELKCVEETWEQLNGWALGAVAISSCLVRQPCVHTLSRDHLIDFLWNKRQSHCHLIGVGGRGVAKENRHRVAVSRPIGGTSNQFFISVIQCGTDTGLSCGMLGIVTEHVGTFPQFRFTATMIHGKEVV